MRAEVIQRFRFSRVHLENWRNFSDVAVELQRRAFLVGPNASGKSNFLDAFRFLRDIAVAGGGLREAVGRRAGVKSLRCLAARRYPDVALTVDVADADGEVRWSYELRLNNDNRGQPIIKRECVFHQGTALLTRPNSDDKGDLARLTQTHLEQVTANKDFRELVDFFASVRYLHIVPQLVREPDRSVGRQDDPYGGDFLEQIARKNVTTRNSWLRRIQTALEVAVPQLRQLEWLRDDRGVSHLRGNYQHWRPHGAWQQEDAFSDGSLRLIGLLWAVLDGSGPLLLEEPELSLHPGVVQHLPQMLSSAQRRTGRQVLLSTHSSELLQDTGIGLDEVLLLLPQDEGSSIQTAGSLKDATELLRGGMSLAEVVMPRTRPKNVEQLTFFPRA